MRNHDEYERLPAAVLNLGSGVVAADEQADLFPFFESFLDPQDTQGLEGGETSQSSSHMDMLDDTLFARVKDFKQAVCTCTVFCSSFFSRVAVLLLRGIRVETQEAMCIQ